VTRWQTQVTVLLMATTLLGGCASESTRPFDDWQRNSGRGDTYNQQDAYGALALVVLYVGVLTTAETVKIIGDIAGSVSGQDHNLAPTPQAQPLRLLQTVHGSVCDKDGRALAGVTLAARNTGRYMASPEQLPATTVRTGADGTFTLLMATTDAVCVDFAAEGMRPMRRWFVVDSPGVSATLPKDRAEILLVTPYAHVVRVVPAALAMEAAP
jgi:hypothetical protein